MLKSIFPEIQIDQPINIQDAYVKSKMPKLIFSQNSPSQAYALKAPKNRRTVSLDREILLVHSPFSVRRKFTQKSPEFDLETHVIVRFQKIIRRY